METEGDEDSATEERTGNLHGVHKDQNPGNKNNVEGPYKDGIKKCVDLTKRESLTLGTYNGGVSPEGTGDVDSRDGRGGPARQGTGTHT